MKENRKSNGVSASSRKGFVSLYFLILFLLITILIGILLARENNRIKTASNLRKSNIYLREEAIVMNLLKCELRNERMEEGSFEENGVTFEAIRTANGWRIIILSPAAEELIVTCRDAQTVYDYDVIRDEMPA